MPRGNRCGLPARAGVLGCGLALAALITLASCDRKEAHKPPPRPVTVAAVARQTIPVSLNFVGTTRAVKSVVIRARVEGFLLQQAFVDGADVNKGDLLFVIDPRPLQAALDQNEAKLAKDEAALAFARKEVERYRPLVEKEFVTREQFQAVVTKADEAAAAVAADRAAIEEAKLNLSYTKMYAPFDGRMGQRLVDVGNLVGAGQDTKLAHLVQLDPIYVYFSPSDRESVEILGMETGIQAASPEGKHLTVTVLLADGSQYPHEGDLTFIDNVVDPEAGTLTMRATLPNPEHRLRPGQVVQVRLHLKEQSDTLLIPEKAVKTLQGGTVVLVVDKDDKVEQRSVRLGATYNGNRVVESGLHAGERVITEGLQQVRAGMEVKPTTASDSAKEGQRPGEHGQAGSR